MPTCTQLHVGHAYVCMCAHTHARTHRPTYACTCTCMNACAHARACVCTCTHARTHAHNHLVQHLDVGRAIRLPCVHACARAWAHTPAHTRARLAGLRFVKQQHIVQEAEHLVCPCRACVRTCAHAGMHAGMQAGTQADMVGYRRPDSHERATCQRQHECYFRQTRRSASACLPCMHVGLCARTHVRARACIHRGGATQECGAAHARCSESRG